MKKTKFPALVLLAALCLSLFGGMGVFAAEYASEEDYYVQDDSGVLSQTTKDEIVAANHTLYEACGAQIVVATVEFTGAKSTEKYALDLANELGVGDAEKDNGVLLLLVTGAEDYMCVQGSGLERTLPTSTLSQILQTYLEPDFATGNYDAGVQKTFAALASEVASIYNVSLSGTSNNTTQYPIQQTPQNNYGGNYEDEGGISLFSIFFLIIAIIVVVNVVRSLSRPRGNYYNNNNYNGYNNGYYNGGYQDHSFRNAFVGSWLANLFFNNNNRRPPRGGGGFGGFGGFGGGGGGSFGGFSGGGGGGFRGGGAGRGR